MDGLAEAMQNNIRRVYAFTDSELLYDQVSLSLDMIFASYFYNVDKTYYDCVKPE
jgi:hypothetical protein